MRKKYYKSTAGHDTRRHAWRRSSAESRIQLFVARGARSPGSSPARDPGDGRCGTESVVAKLRQHVCQSGPAVDRAGEVVASAVAADAVFDPQRVPSDGRNGLQLAVPLVCRAERGRPGVGRDRFYQEPGPVVAGGRGQGVSGGGGGTGWGEGPDFG